MENFSFDVMYKTEKCATVDIINNVAHIKKYSPNPIHCMFNQDNIPVFKVLERLESRCWPRDRQNIQELLAHIGLTEYNILGIIRKTHGLMRNDYTWIRFSDENISYNDIKIRE